MEQTNICRLSGDINHRTPKIYTHSFAYHQDCGRAQRKNPKCTKTLGCRGFAPDPTGEHTAFLQTPSWWGEAYRPLLKNPILGSALRASALRVSSRLAMLISFRRHWPVDSAGDFVPRPAVPPYLQIMSAPLCERVYSQSRPCEDIEVELHQSCEDILAARTAVASDLRLVHSDCPRRGKSVCILNSVYLCVCVRVYSQSRHCEDACVCVVCYRRCMQSLTSWTWSQMLIVVTTACLWAGQNSALPTRK